MLGSSGYATRTKELLGLVNQLHALGAQSDIDLPRITVIGNQSAGKSSVVEAISGITVPRDAGTCTRCPMECRISSSPGPWQCRISIRREYDLKHKRLDDINEIPFGNIIVDKSQVETALRRAQLSVLNPSIPTHKILDATPDQLSEWLFQSVKASPFSRNVVCVDLEGPELTDLSFIDLPGLIANADTEIVQLVEEMVISHVRGNCIILVALPMTDDIENQKALKLARVADPRGLRTIGVMTKPDMLLPGSTKSLSLWLDVIEGRRHPLAHGYYCTRQPDDEQRSQSMTAADARVVEKEFFNTTMPWAKSSHPHRFGTEHLISTLSRLLVRVIDTTLPNIRQNAIDSLQACRNELSKIPPKIQEDPVTHLLKLITAFASEIRTVVKGRSSDSSLIQDNRAAFRKLKIAIRSTAPNFIPAPKAGPQVSGVQYLEDEDEDLRLIGEPQGTRFDLTDMRQHIAKSMTRELPNNVPFEAKVALILKFQEHWAAVAQQCFETLQVNMERLLFKYVDDEFSRYHILNGHMKTFLIELMSLRSDACRDVIEAILETEKTPFTQNTHYLESTTDKWLAKYKDVRSGKKTQSVEPEQKRKKTEATQPPKQSFFNKAPEPSPFGKASESVTFGTGSVNSPFIIDSPAKGGKPVNIASAASAAFNPFGTPQQNGGVFAFGPPSQARPFPTSAPSIPPQPPTNTPQPLVPTPDVEKVKEALALLAGLGYYHIQPEDLAKLNPTDEYEMELKVMAEIRGYFQVAYKRVIDMVPAVIDSVFVQKLAEQLQHFLIEKFGMGTAGATERCASYLAEDSAVVARRDELLARERRLTSVQQQLVTFGISSASIS